MRNPKTRTTTETKTVADPSVAKLQKDVDFLAKAVKLALDGKGGDAAALKDAAEALAEASQKLSDRPPMIGLEVIRGADKRVRGMVAYTDPADIKRIMKQKG